MQITHSRKFNTFIFLLALLGVIIILVTIFIYSIHSHIKLFTDVDKEYFGIFGEFIGGVVGTLFSIITTILVFLTFKAQQVDVRETKKLLQKQIDLSIKPDLFFTNSPVFGFSKITSEGIGYPLEFSNNRNANTAEIRFNTFVYLVNIGVGVAKNIEYHWEFDLAEIQNFFNDNFEDSPLIIENIAKPFVELKIKGFKDKVTFGLPYFKNKQRFDILTSDSQSSQKLQLPFPLLYLKCYFLAITLFINNRKTSILDNNMSLNIFPKCKLHLTYKDISEKQHSKTFDFLFRGHGSFLVESKTDGEEMFGYDIYALEI